MAEIEFDKDFPEIIQPQIAELLNNAKWILPAWIQRLYVGFHADDRDSNATMKVDHVYRFARLTICGHFLSETSERQIEIVYHEFIHCFVSVLTNYAKEIVDIYCPEDESPKTNKMLCDELTRKNEEITQDFAYVIANKFKEEK